MRPWSGLPPSIDESATAWALLVFGVFQRRIHLASVEGAIAWWAPVVFVMWSRSCR